MGDTASAAQPPPAASPSSTTRPCLATPRSPHAFQKKKKKIFPTWYASSPTSLALPRLTPAGSELSILCARRYKTEPVGREAYGGVRGDAGVVFGHLRRARRPHRPTRMVQQSTSSPQLQSSTVWLALVLSLIVLAVGIFAYFILDC